MVTIVVRHHVRDYDAWKPVFDDHEAVRRQHGSTGHRLLRLAEDPNEIVIALDFPSAEAAQAFSQDPSLREAMDRGGVDREPEIMVGERIEAIAYEPATV
jgi:heme-degrading monooxygenase HmoA